MSQNQETNPHFTRSLDSQPHEQRRNHRPSGRQYEQHPDQNRDFNFPPDDGPESSSWTQPPFPQRQTRQSRREPQGQDEQQPGGNHDEFPMHDGLRASQATRPTRQHRSSRTRQPKLQWAQLSPFKEAQQLPEDAPAQQPGAQYIRTPAPQKTKFITWCIGVFCALFWVVVIVGGLIVLIVYLVFRPHIPRFDIMSATLNAAYVDMGYYLNADLTMLANFTNPNRKVSVDYSTVILELYYGGHPIATHYIPPFSAPKATNMLANVEFISSQVQLPLKESQGLQQQLANNQLVVFEVRGMFRARSNLGSFLRYSYWLYGHCSIAMSGPPSGVMRGSKCRTRR